MSVDTHKYECIPDFHTMISTFEFWGEIDFFFGTWKKKAKKMGYSMRGCMRVCTCAHTCVLMRMCVHTCSTRNIEIYQYMCQSVYA